MGFADDIQSALKFILLINLGTLIGIEWKWNLEFGIYRYLNILSNASNTQSSSFHSERVLKRTIESVAGAPVLF